MQTNTNSLFKTLKTETVVYFDLFFVSIIIIIIIIIVINSREENTILFSSNYIHT